MIMNYPKHYRVIQRKAVYQGFYTMEVVQVEHESYLGGMAPTICRELMCRANAVCVLLVDFARDAVVLVEQFRVGALAQRRPWLLEPVAGLIEPDEAPEAVARREAQEEAGLTIARLHKLYEYFPSPGGSDETVHLYIGEVDSQSAGGVHGLPDEGEDIQVVVLTFEEAFLRMRQGQMNTASVLLSLQWLQWHQHDLRQQWGYKPVSI